MPTYLTPNVYMEELSSGAKPILGVSTSTACFIGVAEKGPIGKATFISNLSEFVKYFGGPIRINPITSAQYDNHYLYYAVQHFFQEGGAMCYVVRVAHYDDLDDPLTLNAKSSFHNFDCVDISGSTVAGVLPVEAISAGEWGDKLEVQVESSSKFSLQLKSDILSGLTAATISLASSSDVQVGSLLWIIKEVSGVISSVDEATGKVEFLQLTQGGTPFPGSIAGTVPFFSGDFKLITEGSSFAAGPPASMTLSSVRDIDNVLLKKGAAIGIVEKQALVVVTSVGEAMIGPEKVTTVDVDFGAQDSEFFATSARVYARDFALRVKSDGEVVEVHEGLSIVLTNASDYVGNRLGPTSNNSLYISAKETATADELLVKPTAYTSLAGGDDGRTGLNDADFLGSGLLMTGLNALDLVSDASILVIPNASETVSVNAIAYIKKRKDMFYITECPLPNLSGTDPTGPVQAHRNVFGSESYAAIYHPWIKISDPFTGRPVRVPPSGAVAGVYADTDARRGVHKAPAGIEDGYLNVATGIDSVITPGQNDLLYPLQINVIRKFPEGIVVWGGRTMSQDTEWIYINVRRLFIFLEQSIENGTQWTVFEPNDRTLWKSIERNVAAFLRIQWRKGALVGEKEEQAFYVKCDEETNPQEVIDAGQVITEIGVAPSKPAEFVVFRITQSAGVAS